MTKKEIVDAFADIKILHGDRGIHFIVDQLNHRNDAFIQLASREDYELAVNRKSLRHHSFIKSSYIFSTLCGWNEWQLALHLCEKIDFIWTFLVKLADIDVFMNLVSRPSYPMDQRVLRLKELPLKCTTKDIQQYFNGKFFFSNIHHNVFKTKRFHVSFFCIFYHQNRTIDFRSSFDSW